MKFTFAVKLKEDDNISKNTNLIVAKDDYSILCVHSDTFGDYEFVIDSDVVELIREYTWNIHHVKDRSQYYASANTNVNGKQSSVLLHRLIMGNPRGMCVDHIDGNTFNNLKSNLRICSITENSRNTNDNKDNKSGHKGVLWNTFSKTPVWVAYITVNRKKLYLGHFDDFDEACKARENAELKYYKEFSRLNCNKCEYNGYLLLKLDRKGIHNL